MAGNQNSGRKDKEWRDALRLALKRSDGDRTKLARIAEKTIELAMAGDMQAIKEIGDRIDGKPKQAVDHGGQEENPVLHEIRRVIVDPKS